jgi:GDP-mannose 6-dehydrogenase
MLIEMLIGKGYKLSIYDEEVSLARLVGANRHYIEHAIPHISSLMLTSLPDVFERNDLIIVSKKTPEIEKAIINHSGSRTIIDLVRLSSAAASGPGKYDGICW